MLLPCETERCAKTGKIVAPDVLQPCAVTGKRSKPALTAEIKSMFGLRTQHAGILYSLNQKAVLGRVAVVKRDGRGSFRQLDSGFDQRIIATGAKAIYDRRI